VKRDGQLTQTTFFKYAFLNGLRDEVGLTLAFQKVTLFHFLCLAIPAAGFGAGSAWEAHTHNLLREIIGGLIGLVIGVVVSWPLPKLFWNILCLFVRKGWLLQPKFPENVPVMTSDEFIARSKALRREAKHQFLVWSLILIAGAFGCARLCFYMDRAKPQTWIQVSVSMGVLAFFAGWFFLRKRVSRQIIKKHGLQCPACDREITGAAGLSRIPYLGLCRHCGTKIVEVKT
jgi:hypothetical protein